MGNLTISLKAFLKRCVRALIRINDACTSAKHPIVVCAILGIWLIGVIFTATQHEFWRDEVRPLSLSRAAISPLDLYSLIRYEGHPVLWFLLLYISKSVVDTPLVLPVISVIIAFAAVAVFMFFSPFPFWIRCLFIFSALPFYEYSVMARNYGISMLFLFVSAALYRNRTKYPWLLAFVLAALANTNVHSAILVCLIAAVWVWDTVAEQRTLSAPIRGFYPYQPLIVVFAGVLLCAFVTMPSENTILTHVRSVNMPTLVNSLFDSVLRPDKTFWAIVPAMAPFLVTIALLYLVTIGLLHRFNLLLAAFAAQIAFGVFFRVVYGGAYRHQGVFLVFVLFLYWLFVESLSTAQDVTKTKRVLFNMGYVALLILIFANVSATPSLILGDVYLEKSSSKVFGEFLNKSETYHNAIIIPEPDNLLESLPYYATNQIYFPREHRFGTTVSWTTNADSNLSLGKLLSIARDIKMRYGQPVLIVLGHWDIDTYMSREKEYSYNKIFAWNISESKDFDESTMLVAEFASAVGDENYRVYTLK